MGKTGTSGAFMHHSACWEMRSKPDADGHGHQATYDADGKLITDSIMAGTADMFSPTGVIFGKTNSHRLYDVLPYLPLT